jgi:uncharacterized protein
MLHSHPYLAAIYLFPVKSLDGLKVSQATVLKSGALRFDREFALFDQQGHFVNGKRNAKVHQLRTTFQLDQRLLSLRVEGNDEAVTFHLDNQQTALNTWFSNYFNQPVHLRQDLVMGFPDDTNAPGPTIVSTATLAEIASWFPNLTPEQVRLRVRANLEIDGVPAFWEDQLFTNADQVQRFQIGDVLFEGINPCQRCVVLTRDAMTGEAIPNFQKIFIRKRQETLPNWVEQSRFNHFFRLTVNTRIPASEEGKTLLQGDRVELLG